MRLIAERRAKTDFNVRTANSKRPKGCTILFRLTEVEGLDNFTGQYTIVS